jgi:hypothetical protein
MRVTAIFETWHIGDGNYPPLGRGQLVNLSFELEPRAIAEANPDGPDSFEHLGNAEYRFRGSVLKAYDSKGHILVAVQAAGFRFYIVTAGDNALVRGTRVAGDGTLLLDHYLWVEFPRDYEDPPNLFYNLAVERIRKVTIPERFITRHASGKAYPTRLAPGDYAPPDVEDVETMEGQRFDEEFYILDFNGEGLEGASIPRTFA